MGAELDKLGERSQQRLTSQRRLTGPEERAIRFAHGKVATLPHEQQESEFGRNVRAKLGDLRTVFFARKVSSEGPLQSAVRSYVDPGYDEFAEAHKKVPALDFAQKVAAKASAGPLTLSRATEILDELLGVKTPLRLSSETIKVIKNSTEAAAALKTTSVRAQVTEFTKNLFEGFQGDAYALGIFMFRLSHKGMEQKAVEKEAKQLSKNNPEFKGFFEKLKETAVAFTAMYPGEITEREGIHPEPTEHEIMYMVRHNQVMFPFIPDGWPRRVPKT